MSLVPSLLQAIVHVDGEALVMHAGDKPYVVSPSGQVDLATRGLALEAVNGIVGQLLPADLQRTLDEVGAVQHELEPIADFPGEQFTIVAARGGDDLWVEIRRRRIPDEDALPEELFPSPEVAAAAQPYPVYATAGSPSFSRGAEHLRDAVHDEGAVLGRVEDGADMTVTLPDANELWPGAVESERAIERRIEQGVTPRIFDAPQPPFAMPPTQTAAAPVQEPVAVTQRAIAAEAPPTSAAAPAAPAAPQAVSPPVQSQPAPSQPAVVLPLARGPIRQDPMPPLDDPMMSGLDRLLRLSAARGASALYLSSDSKPALRVEGDLQVLEGEPVLAGRDVESLLLTLMPERSHEALRTGAATEWICDIEAVGRVRCMSFRDHRGPGGVFRLMPMRSVSADQLGLSRVVQALAIEPEGLVLMAGPRSSGKRTLIAAFVDLINRTRRDHVITIEREINVVHERGSSFISQREVRGGDHDMLEAARAALREDPDVLVVEDLRTAGLMNVALEAAASGHLVVGGFAAHTATAAIDRIIDLYAPEQRRQVQLALADCLRAVVLQVLLRKNGGGRIAAREVLLNTPAVSSVVAEGRTSQLPLAIEGGRRYGMVPLNDALAGLVQQGAVDGREAYRYASDRPGLLGLLKRHGVDTSFVERLA